MYVYTGRPSYMCCGGFINSISVEGAENHRTKGQNRNGNGIQLTVRPHLHVYIRISFILRVSLHFGLYPYSKYPEPIYFAILR